MKRSLSAVLSAIGLLLAATGAEVTAEQAARAAGNWVRGGYALDRRIGADPSGVERLSSTNGVSFHVVRMKDGGFVVLGADTSVGPVIAFSSSGSFQNDPRNPLTALLRADLQARAAAGRRGRLLSASASSGGSAAKTPESRWARLLADAEGADDGSSPRKLLSASNGRETLSDVRAGPLVASAWSQQDYRNYGYTDDSDVCYNYYTPNHWPCGCVATVGAQILRHHAYPKESVTPGTYPCSVADKSVDLTMQGGVYEWANMPLVPSEGCTEVQRQAIGKLTSDVGISCGMAYDEDGSSSPVYMLTKRLVDRFGYANAVGVTFDSFYSGGGCEYTLERFKAAVIPNFDAGLPVALGISGGRGGHAVVGDGYGYSDGEFFVHVNLGWANKDGGNAWYRPPDIDDFSSIDSIVYNVFPTGTAGASIVSGRTLDEAGSPLAGAVVTAKSSGKVIASATSDRNGIYALVVPKGTYSVTATRNDASASADVQVGACVSTSYTDDGYYMSSPRPSVGNVPNVDLTLECGEPPEEEEPSVDFIETANLATGVEIDPILLSVKGFRAPRIVARGLPPGLSLASGAIVGIPGKSGVYVATFTVTSEESMELSFVGSTTFVVRAAESSEHAAYACCDVTAGKVTGGCLGAAGKQVTLKATAGKDRVFDGWDCADEAGADIVRGHEFEPTLKFKMPATGDVRLQAKFVTKGEVADSIGVRTENGEFDGKAGSDTRTLLQGVRCEWRLDAEARHPLGSIKVTGLPSGLKFTAKAIVDKKTGVTNVPPNTIYGYPSAASKKAKDANDYTPSSVKVTLATTTKVSREFTWHMTVLPLPDWTVGTFAGHMSRAEEAEGGMVERSAASLTVGKTGKVSGKFNTYDSATKKTLKWTFSADGFAESDFDGSAAESVEEVRIRAVAKGGKLVRDVELEICREDGGGSGPGLATARVTGGEFELWRNIWKDKSAAMTEFAKTYSLLQGSYNAILAVGAEDGVRQCGYLTLKVDARGGVKAAGKLPDGSSASFAPMLAYEDGEFSSMTVVEPSAYKGGYASVALRFVDGMRVEGRGDWLNRSPTASTSYGVPDIGAFTVRGSLYDKNVKLSSFFDEMAVSSAVPDLEYTYKEKSATGTATDPSRLAEPQNAVETVLTVDTADKLKAASAVGKPVDIDKANGIWNYDAPNVESVTVAFTPSTGVFKGSYVGWYDYVSAVDTVKGTTTWSHASKKYAFEGLWVQDPSGETAGELTGFIMFDRTGWQTDAQTGKQKSYKYKVNRSMSLGRDL